MHLGLSLYLPQLVRESRLVGGNGQVTKLRGKIEENKTDEVESEQNAQQQQ